MIRASGRTAVILATGLLVCFAGAPLASAAPDESSAKAVKRHHAQQRSGKAARSSDDQAETSKAKDANTADAGGGAPLSATVADANAQMPAPDNPAAASASAMTARATDLTQAAANSPPATEAQVVAPDQLNDLDRALSDDPPAPKVIAMASAEAPAASSSARSQESSEGSAWDQSSLIGKIFISFGALLTVASAARMFIA